MSSRASALAFDLLFGLGCLDETSVDSGVDMTEIFSPSTSIWGRACQQGVKMVLS